MAKILFNKRLSEDFFLLGAQEPNQAAMGQFYMLRAWDAFPLLSRPISVFDADNETVTFLYKVVGQGTRLFSRLRPGDSITLQGPYGNTFPRVSGRVALVGGGVGIAPLYLAAKTLRGAAPPATVDIYLGFSGRVVLEEEYRALADRLVLNVGGFITDEIDPAAYDAILTCGPEPMMRALYEKCRAVDAAHRLYVSMEKRMACGLGACLVCTCKTTGGNRKVCRDGPVFPGGEVFSA